MKGRILDRHFPTILAAGSVMEIWPMDNYDQYMPDPMVASGLGRYWENVQSYLHKAVVQYELGQQTGPGKGLYDE